VGSDAVFAGTFGDRATEIRLPRLGDPLEDDVLPPGHEGADAELDQQLPVGAALVEQVDAAQVSVDANMGDALRGRNALPTNPDCVAAGRVSP
jgi:hypothetical protein